MPTHITVYDLVYASFIANQTGGTVPLHVKFTDNSTGDPTSWVWDFGDGTRIRELQNPIYIYIDPGNYSVTLTASNGFSSQTSTTLDFIITVYGDLAAQFIANQTAGPNPFTVRFTDTSLGNPTAWVWDFGDDGISIEKNPVHTYSTAGTYNVILTVSHPHGSIPSASTPITVYTPITRRIHRHTTEGAGSAPGSVHGHLDRGRRHETLAVRRRLAEFDRGESDSRLHHPRHPLRREPDGLAPPAAGPGIHHRADHGRGLRRSRGVLPGPAGNRVTPRSRSGSRTPRTAIPSSWVWDFGDGTPLSTERNPMHIFTTGDGRAYTVMLRVSNPAGPDLTPAIKTITVM